MGRQRAVFPAEISSDGLPDDEVRVTISTGQRARDGHILEPAGCILTNYLANPIVLWSHDPVEPIGNNFDVAVVESGIVARTKFAPAGISQTADRIRGLVKSGVVRGVSIGFDILEGEPIEPGKPWKGIRASAWELFETSFVSIPADTGATVTQRADADWKVGAARDLPVQDSDEWDGPEAEKSIFDHAGGEDFDPAKARKGFLVYNATSPKLRGSYKLPIAHVVDGALQVPKGAIRAAASRLPQTDIPDAVKTEAEGVLNHYKEQAGMKDGEDGRSAAVTALRKRMLTGGPARPSGVRGLSDISCLAWVLGELGWVHSSSVWEAELENDGSPVPAMLGEAMRQLGEALIAMTQEEVTEMLAGKGLVDIEEGELLALPAEERAYVSGGKTVAARNFRIGMARMRLRAGRVLSKGNAKKLADGIGHIDAAKDKIAEATGYQAETRAAHETAMDAHGSATTAHEKLGDALAAAKDAPPEEAGKHIDAAAKQHKALARHMDAVGESHETMALSQGNAQDATNAADRCMRAAQRCMRSVMESAPDADPKEVQTSEGVGESGGAENNRTLSQEARMRRARLLELASVG